MKNLLLILSTLFIFKITAQIDLNTYKRLESKGKLPHFLKTELSTLVKEDQKNKRVHFLDDADEEEFLNLAYQRLVRRFLVGDCIYGDEISNYVEALAKQCYGSNTSELKGIDFVTVNSNSAFVRGVYPGVVFVSTGLIAQVENEAQLAFWILQGIAQVKLNLDQKIYLSDLSANTSNFDQINPLEFAQEVSADSLAFIQFNQTPFASKECTAAMLVKIYSYLPFEDLFFPRNYFNTSNYFIPEQQFGKKEFPIKTTEEFSDIERKNLVKRQTLLELKTKNTGTKTYVNDEQILQRIKDVGRMELVRISMSSGEYVLGVYQIFILEKKVKNSIYLDRLKAYAWYNIMAERQTGNLQYNKASLYNCEGEICHLFHLLQQKKKDEIITLSLRQIYDLHKKHPTDKAISTIYSKMINRLAENKNFTFLAYKSSNFYQLDSLSKLEPPSNKSSEQATKYDKIASKKGPVGIDTSAYYLYGIPDIIADPTFENAFKTRRDSIEKSIVAVNLSEMTPKERFRYQKQQAKEAKSLRSGTFGVDSVLIVSPNIFIRQSNRFSTDKIVQYREDFTQTLLDNSAKNGVYTMLLDLKSVQITGSTEFNKLMLYCSLGKAIMNSNESNGILLDQLEFEHYIKNESQRYVVYPIVFCNPHASLQIRLLLFDTKEAKVIYDQTESLNGKPYRSLYNVLVYNFFKRFKE